MRLLLLFFALTYFVSWTLFTTAAAITGGTLSPPAGLPLLSNALFLLGVFAPSIVAVALTACADGHSGTSALLRGVLQWPAAARFYVFAVGYFAAIEIAAAVVHRVVVGTWPLLGGTPWYLMAGAIVVSTPVQAGEEIGWRGYALPRLASQVGLAPASIILGAIWACWHLPLFFIPGTNTSGASFPVYLLGVTALSVAMVWLYWRTNASLFMMMLMHAAINNTRDIVASPASAALHPFAVNGSLMTWLTGALLWICAAYFLVQMRGATLQDDLYASMANGEVRSAGSS